MTNPYAAPPIVPEPKRGVALWRRLVGFAVVALSLIVAGYGALICLLLLLGGLDVTSGPPTTIGMLALGSLILTFGLGLLALGIGIWAQRKVLVGHGVAVVGLSFAAYVAIGMTWM